MAASDTSHDDRPTLSERLARTLSRKVHPRNARVAAVDRLLGGVRALRAAAAQRRARKILASLLAPGLALHAEAALCPLADHRHHADDPAAVGRRLRLHGAPLAIGDAAPVGGGGPRHRGDRRHDRHGAERRRLRQHRAHRAGPAGAEDRHPATGPAAGAWSQAVLFDPRRGAERADHRPHRTAVLAGHGRQLQHHRNPHPAEEERAEGLCAPQPGLCVEFAHLPGLDGGHVAGPADDRDPVPAQPDQADHPTGCRRRKLRQGPADAERLSSARCRRGAPRRPGLHSDARTHRAPDRPAHGHAHRRQP